MTQTKNIGEYLRKKLAEDRELANLVEEEAFNASVGQQIHDCRVEAGLTQKQLAELVVTSQSTIARLEDADYGRHSLQMLKRIARALGKRVRVEFYAPPCYHD